jgi:hypothetical protein
MSMERTNESGDESSTSTTMAAPSSTDRTAKEYAVVHFAIELSANCVFVPSTRL